MSLLRKQPSEIRLYDFDMSSGGLRPGEEITSVIDISAAALDECSNQVSGVELVTFPGSPAISGQVVQAQIAGGASGTLYKITIKFSTDSSPVCEEDFLLYVQDT